MIIGIIILIAIAFLICRESFESSVSDSKSCYDGRNRCQKVEKTIETCDKQYTSENEIDCQNFLEIMSDISNINNISGVYRNPVDDTKEAELIFDPSTLSGDIILKSLSKKSKTLINTNTYSFKAYHFITIGADRQVIMAYIPSLKTNNQINIFMDGQLNFLNQVFYKINKNKDNK